MELKTILIIGLILSTILLSGCQNSYESCKSDCYRNEKISNQCQPIVDEIFDSCNSDKINEKCFAICSKQT